MAPAADPVGYAEMHDLATPAFDQRQGNAVWRQCPHRGHGVAAAGIAKRPPQEDQRAFRFPPPLQRTRKDIAAIADDNHRMILSVSRSAEFAPGIDVDAAGPCRRTDDAEIDRRLAGQNPGALETSPH